MGVDKCLMSPFDLKHYKAKVHTWNPVEIVKTLFRTGFESYVHNSSSNVDELMIDLLCFGSKEVLCHNLRFTFFVILWSN